MPLRELRNWAFDLVPTKLTSSSLNDDGVRFDGVHNAQTERVARPNEPAVYACEAAAASAHCGM